MTDKVARVHEALRVWNGAVSARPAVVKRCHDAAEVSEAVRYARATGLPLSVFDGGHDWTGRAIRPGGLVIDLRGMRAVTVDGNIATVAGGATATDVLAAAAHSGLSAATGTAGSIGMAGLTLGGAMVR
ncbi:FAD-binding protein [Saccharothrix yanglingensis]|uniref:FAD-binding protein n=1 Tax=Saccharothrix yanglingensis TaxID=659496 RepID=UPI0027D20D63|nr:FAD-binding protein [Saccharothrix yanglingensis]